MKTDPKPTLSRAAIECNIEYYQAKIRQARQDYRQAKRELKSWQQKKEQINEVLCN